MNYKDCDIFIFSLSRWDDKYSSPALSLAKEFTKNHRVFYMSHPFTVKDLVKDYNETVISRRKSALVFGRDMYEEVGNFPNPLMAVTPRMTLPINWIPKSPVHSALLELNNRIVISAIRQTIKDFKIKKMVYINSFDPYYATKLPKDIEPYVSVYQCIDDMEEAAYIARHGARLEPKAVADADICIATSRELTRIKSQFSKNTYLLPNAADLSIFNKARTIRYPFPMELRGFEKRKVIGYTGNINEVRIHYDLLRKVALAHKDKVLLMVGPLNSSDYKDFGLDKIPNIVFTGGKNITELPHYLQHIDCALIPFLRNKLTKSIYPLKINEYLAAGRAVVATNFSEDIRSFSDVIEVADSDEAFIQLIDKAIDEDSPEKIAERVKIAESNTWEARVEQFWEIVSNYKKEKTPINQYNPVNI
ncbi:MAG: glycosyltransferase [Chitinophagales bacterium]